MPKIDKQSSVNFSYSEDEIIKLIIQDLAETHGISAAAKDIHAMISGVKMYDENEGYSGGFGQSLKCDPVEFNGFKGSGTLF